MSKILLNKNYKYYAAYLLLAILAYWQISFFQNVLKWDMLDAYLPWRSFISESIVNFHFPLWNPYQDYGYPIHADMRSIWSPEVWLMSLFGGYSIYTFSILFILYTSLAGIGMKLFSNLFLENDKAAFFTGAVYMLSGYLTGHAQELYTINSFYLIPIVLYQYFKFYKAISIKRGVYFILSIFMLLTSAYQAHSFTMLYFLIALFIFFVAKLIGKKQYAHLKLFVLGHAVFALIIGLLLLPLAVSAYQVLPDVSRLSSGVNASTISAFPFSPQSMLSLIVPFAVIRDIGFFETDLSMTNLYFGIIPLVFLLVFFVKPKKNRAFAIILTFGIIALIASFGAYTPLRKILFYHVPFMNMFRGSAYFRIFPLIAFCIASGFILLKIKDHKKLLILSSFIVLGSLLVTAIHGLAHINFNTFSFLSSKYSYIDLLSRESGFYENLLVQSLVQIGFLLFFIGLLIKNKANYRNIILLTIVNLVMAIQFNIYSTAVSKHTPKNVAEFLHTLPVGFPIPDTLPINQCTDKSNAKSPLWRNTSTLAKCISGDAFNSFRLDKTAFFKDSLNNLRNTITANQLLYFSNNIKPLSEIDTATFCKQTLFIHDSIYARYKDIKSETALTKSHYKITRFEPAKIKAEVFAEKNTFLTLIQTNYKGWAIYIDNKPAKIIESNTIFISVYMPKGKHEIQFIYENKPLLNAFILASIILFILLILALYFFNCDTKPGKYFYLLVFILVIFSGLYNQIRHRQKQVNFTQKIQPLVEEEYNFLLDETLDLKASHTFKIDLANKQNTTQLCAFLENNKHDTLVFAYKNKRVLSEFKALLPLYYNKTNALLNLGHSKIILCHTKKDKHPLYSNYLDANKTENSEEEATKNSFLNCKIQEYIETYTHTLTSKNLDAIAMVNISTNQEIAKDELLFVFTIDKNGKNYHWSANDFADYYQANQNKTTFIKHLNLKEINYPRKAQLKIFIWNKNKRDFNISNYKIYIE